MNIVPATTAPTNRTSRLSHVEINVSDYARSIRFYDTVLRPLGWERWVCTHDCTSYCDGMLKIILSPTEEKYQSGGFHRKRVGLNHLALSARSKAEVDEFYRTVLKANGIPTLYAEGPTGSEEYYAVYFEDPDRMKIEVVFAPKYCDQAAWPNNIPSNFDPNQENV